MFLLYYVLEYVALVCTLCDSHAFATRVDKYECSRKKNFSKLFENITSRVTILVTNQLMTGNIGKLIFETVAVEQLTISRNFTNKGMMQRTIQMTWKFGWFQTC